MTTFQILHASIISNSFQTVQHLFFVSIISHLLSAYRGRYTAQLPNPEEGTNTGISFNSQTNYPYDDIEGGTQDDIDGDLNLPALEDRDERLPFSVVRRGEYQPSSQSKFTFISLRNFLKFERISFFFSIKSCRLTNKHSELAKKTGWSPQATH